MTIANSSVAVDRAATTSSSSSAPAVGGVSISPVISVDHHSESSSLTDDVGSDSWQLINGNAASGGRSGGGSNIFKDAERMGSTFHKSKKIVRPGECVANPRGGGVGGGGTSVPAHPSTPASSARDCVPRSKDGPGAMDATPRLSGSHRQTKEPSHHRLEGSSTSPPTPQHCPASPADTVNSVGNSTFHRTSPSLPPSKTTALASLREDRLPPPLPPSSTSSSNVDKNGGNGGNPFAVKLRKTNQLMQTPTSSIVSTSSSTEKETLNLTINIATTTTTPSIVGAHGSHQSPQRYGQKAGSVNHDEGGPKNPFLAQIKPRKTNGANLIGGEYPLLRDPQVVVAEAAKEVHRQEDREDAKKKLTYREQQELARQQRQEQEDAIHKPKEEEPTRDVAAIIRERIAASKSNSLARLNFGIGGDVTPSSNDQSNGNVGSWRGKLKNISESASPSITSSAVASREVDTSMPVSSSVNQSYSNTNKPEGGRFIPIKRQTAAVAPAHDDEKDAVACVKSSSSEREEEADPRAALMDMLKKRGDSHRAPAPAARSTSTPTLENDRENADEEQPRPDPRSALSDMLSKRGELGGPSPDHRLSEKKGRPQQDSALSAMLAQRAPQQSSLCNTGRSDASPSAQEIGGGRNGRPALKNDPK